MSGKTIIGVAALGLIVLLIIILSGRHDGSTRLQRDIAESLEKAKELNVERDLIREYEHERRFAKEADEPKVTFSEFSNQKKAEPVAFRSSSPDTDVPPRELKSAIEEENQGRSRSAVAALASVEKGRFFTTGEMDGLRPKGKKHRFRAGDTVYAYAEVNTPQAEHLRLEWVNEGGKIQGQPNLIKVDVNTGASGFRVYKYHKFTQEGNYEARLYNQSGLLIATTEFKVVD